MGNSLGTYDFEKIYLLEESLNSELGKRILTLFPSQIIEVVEEDPFKLHRGQLSSEQFNKSKKILLVKKFAGQFFKRCPGASQKKTLNCCNYHVLNLGQQCNMNCSYCYLQSYLNTPATIIYSNINDALQELSLMAESSHHLPFRVGTGEVIDSLSLDEISLFSRQLITHFKQYPKWTLEFKTKSDKVDQFLECEHAGNVVVSWSVNANEIVNNEEHGTASLEKRLIAAEKCVKHNFPIAFHIDPIIYYADWKKGYGDLIDQITKRFTPNQVNVISLGTLRFQPEQRHLMKERFGMKSYVNSAEMFASEGNKLRYDFQTRKQMFDFVINKFKSNSNEWRVFLCMETPETWISSFEKTPLQIPELKNLFRPLPKMLTAKNQLDLE